MGQAASTSGSAANTVGKYNSLRYRGYYYDSETGYYYLQSRYYDPGLKRFINADEPELISYLTQAYVLGGNLFAYCENDCVNSSDFNGFKSKSKNTTQTFSYNREAAYNYMKKYYNAKEKYTSIFGRKCFFSVSGNNPYYLYFKTGDCANFVSQCLYAGGVPMIKDWYYKKYYVTEWHCNYSIKRTVIDYSKSWSMVSDQEKVIKKYFSDKSYDVTTISKMEKNVKSINKGDVIYFRSKNKSEYGHAAIISQVDTKYNVIKYAQHSSSKLYGDLRSIVNSKRYDKIVIYHIKNKITISKSILK